jgi:hypothetical protein
VPIPWLYPAQTNGPAQAFELSWDQQDTMPEKDHENAFQHYGSGTKRRNRA